MLPGRFFWIGLLLFWSSLATASQALLISAPQKEVDLGVFTDFFEDSQGKLSIDEVQALEQESWTRSRESVPNFGFTDSAYWLKFTVDGGEEPRSMLLQIAYPVLDKLELYTPQPDGSYTVRKVGDYEPFDVRDIRNRNFLFKLDIKGQQTYYLRCATKGSMKIPLKLYEPSYFQQVDEKAIIGLAFFCGVIVSMFLYNSFLAITIRDMNYVYYIAYIGLFMIFTLSLSGFAFQYLWPRNIWLANYSVPLTISGACYSALQFSRRFLRTDIHAPLIDKFISLLILWSIGSVLLIPFVSYRFTTQSTTALALFLNLCLITAGMVLVKRGHRSARFYLIAFVTFWSSMATKALQTLGLIPVSTLSENGIIIGSMIEVILLSLALGDKIQIRQKEAQEKIESLNSSLAETVKSLDAKVEEQTGEIRSMLGNIKQGIFMVELVDQKLVLRSDFSRHLTEILGQEDLAGKPLMDVVFGRSNLTSDQLSMIHSVMISCLGEPLIAYEVNADQLPQEFILNAETDSQKVIEIEWCPVLAKDRSTVQKFLVTLRDVSSYRILQTQSQEQRDELQSTLELVNFPNATFLRFVQHCQDLLAENHRLMTSLRSHDPEAIKIMFINMHTLKGAARQLGLSRLTSQIHKAEQIFAELKRDETMPVDIAQIANAQQECEAALQRYVAINQQKLGRSTKVDEIPVERNLLEQVIRSYRQVLEQPLPQQLRQECQDLARDVTNMLYLSAEAVLNDVLRHANTLAKDLHKANPSVTLRSSPVNLTMAGEDFLRRIFIHLVRNSLDHGIEFPEERIAKGKGASGHIQVVMDQGDSDLMRICYRDDGRGINVGKLKHIAQSIGLLKEDEMSDPLKIAYSIFSDGISTSKSVTEISGRGVGMGAVKEYVERLGGRIELKLHAIEDPEFMPFELVLYIPNEKMVA